jgi:predicted esterase
MSSDATPVEPTAMSVTAIKTELARLGVTDLRHCVEKPDLVAELVKARAAPKPTVPPVSEDGEVDGGNLRYARVATGGNTKDPTAMVLFLHGLGDTCDGWASLVPEFSRNLPHVLFALPTAATQPCTLNMGMAMPSWYDIKGLSPQAEEDLIGMRRSAQYMDRIVAQFADKYGIPQSRVVYAGFSQGGCMSLVAGLTSARGRPAGIASLSGYLGSRDWVLPRLRHTDLPIFMAHGTQDPVVPAIMSQMSKAALVSAGKMTAVEYHTYPMGHSSHPDELEDFNKWLQRVLPRD